MSLASNIALAFARAASEAKTIRSLINAGATDLSGLTTTNKTSLVAAINELKSAGGGKSSGFVTVPNIGMYGTAAGITGYGYGSQTPNRLFAHPFWIGPTGWTADAFRTRISQNRVGGQTIRRFALVPDLNGYPDTLPANRLGYAAVDDTATTSGNGGDFPFANGPVALAPGLYWQLSIWAAISGSVTQTANLLCITNAVYGLPTDPFNAPDAVVRSIAADGLNDLPTTRLAQTAFGAHKGNETPLLLLRRSA